MKFKTFLGEVKKIDNAGLVHIESIDSNETHVLSNSKDLPIRIGAYGIFGITDNPVDIESYEMISSCSDGVLVSRAPLRARIYKKSGNECYQVNILDSKDMKQVHDRASFEIAVAQNIVKSTEEEILARSFIFICYVDKSNNQCESIELPMLQDNMESDIDMAFNNIESSKPYRETKQFFLNQVNLIKHDWYIGRYIVHDVKYTNKFSQYFHNNQFYWRKSLLAYKSKEESKPIVLKYFNVLGRETPLMPNACSVDKDNIIPLA